MIQSQTCAICASAPAASFCLCSLAETFLCKGCLPTHFARDACYHQNLPLAVYGQHRLPGYLQRLQARVVNLEKGKEAMRSSVQEIDTCISSVQSQLAEILAEVSSHGQQICEQLLRFRACFSTKVERVIREVENSLFDESPLLESVLSEELRNGQIAHTACLRVEIKADKELAIRALQADIFDLLEEGVRSADGTYYVGQMKEGKKQGQGKIVWTSGDRYQGEFANDEISGVGEFFWCNGKHYKGTFLSGQMHGSGELHFPDNSSYKGDFQGGKYHGSGEFSYSDGRKYTGEYENDLKHGYGVYTWKGGFYEGEWARGKMHGVGWFATARMEKKKFEFREGVKGREVYE